MSNYITGFCQTGACEGVDKRSPSGQKIQSCLGWYSVPTSGTFGRQIEVVCTHSCHDTTRELREMMAAMGKSMPIPERPRLKERPALILRPATVEQPAPAESAPIAAPSGGLLPFQRATVDGLARTPSGRAAKGALEERVRLVLVQAKIFVEMDMVTPGYICRIIDKENPPSQGAVLAVLERWEKKNLIQIADKPKRISKITNLGERFLRLQ